VKKYYSFARQIIAMKDSDGLKYFISDHLGSISLVLKPDGPDADTEIDIEQQRYLPFGAPRTKSPYAAVTSTDFGYTGQRKLDSGMGGIMDYKARMYSPYINRFLQPDSVIPNLYNPQSLNRFSYVRNNPINYSDPSGHCSVAVSLGLFGKIEIKVSDGTCPWDKVKPLTIDIGNDVVRVESKEYNGSDVPLSEPPKWGSDVISLGGDFGLDNNDMPVDNNPLALMSKDIKRRPGGYRKDVRDNVDKKLHSMTMGTCIA
jgi:RHS repeat-associated protein